MVKRKLLEIRCVPLERGTPTVLNGTVKAAGIPRVWRGENKVRVLSKVSLGTGAELKVRQSVFHVERKANAFRAHDVRLLPGNLLGLVMNNPAEVFKLATRKDGRGLGGVR